MPDYVGVPFEADPDVLTQDAIDDLLERRPGLDPKEAHLEIQLVEVISRQNADTRAVARDVPDGIWRYYGRSLVNVPSVEQASATVLTTWTMIDPSGYTIEDGTVAAFRTTGDTLVSFSVVGNYVVEPGTLSMAEVPMEAIEPGEASNKLGPGPMELVDALAFVASVTATRASSGGADAETDAAYMARLKEEMTLLTPRFVLAADAAVLARRIPGVHRAIAVDNYNPVDLSYGNEKMITVAAVDENGLPMSPSTKGQLRDYLDSMREINFIVNVVDPSYTTINVAFTVVALPGFELDDLGQRCASALRDYLNPATWAGGGENPPTWRTGDNVVRYLEVAQVLNETDGVHYVDTLTLNSSSGNVILPGIAPLPLLGLLTGSALNG